MTMSTEETLRLTVAALMQLTRQRQPDVAAAIGLTQPQLSRRQSGKSAWTLTDCDRLAAHWGMPTLDLLAGPTHAAGCLPAARRPTAGTQTAMPLAPPAPAPPAPRRAAPTATPAPAETAPAPAPAAATSSPAPTSTPPSLTSAREELMAATDPLACFGFDGLSERVGKLLYRWQAASRNGTEELIADARDDILKLDLTRVRLPDSAEGRRLRAALLAFAAAETASATTEEPTPTPVPAPAGAGARGGSGGG